MSLQLHARALPQLAGALEVVAGLAAAQRNAEQALRFAGAAASLRTTAGGSRWPHDNQALTRWLQPTRSMLAEGLQEVAWRLGHDAPLDATVGLVLGG